MKPLVTALTLGMALTLAGCGSESAPDASSQSPSVTVTPSTSPASEEGSPSVSPVPDGPDCADVWKVGDKLPAGYKGCIKAGVWVKANSRHCEFGRDLTIYADAYYAVTGGMVMKPGRPLLEQKKYRMVLRSCGG